MKKITFIIAMILGIAVITNPTEFEHRSRVKVTVTEKVNHFISKNINPEKGWQKILLAVGQSLTVDWIERKVDKAITTDDYFVFSVTHLTVKHKPVAVGVGVFGQVWLITDAVDAIDYESFISD